MAFSLNIDNPMTTPTWYISRKKSQEKYLTGQGEFPIGKGIFVSFEMVHVKRHASLVNQKLLLSRTSPYVHFKAIKFENEPNQGFNISVQIGPISCENAIFSIKLLLWH